MQKQPQLSLPSNYHLELAVTINQHLNQGNTVERN